MKRTKESKERGILMSSPMVLVTLAGRKTQTRRIVKIPIYLSDRTPPNCSDAKVGDVFYCPDVLGDGAVLAECETLGTYHCMGNKAFVEKHCPLAKSGVRLYVKEAAWVWCRKVPNGLTKTGCQKFRYTPHDSREVRYVADHPTKPERDSCAQPEMVWRYKPGRFMPRWASRITLEITEVRVQRLWDINADDAMAEGIALCQEPTEGFRELWDLIHGDGAWKINPWVWAYTFKLLHANAH